MSTTPETIYLKDYKPFPFDIEKIDLYFDLHDDHCLVTSSLVCQRKPSAGATSSFRCDGQELELISILMDGKVLPAADYHVTDKFLEIKNPSDSFKLEIVTKIFPQKNTVLEGLYKSGGMFCTQCEAEGFRRITYFPDRPDVMTKYSVTIEADKTSYPVLLSNGNLLDQGNLEKNRHWRKWADPFKKPSYLFALVAGELVSVEDFFTTKSGRAVKLQIFVEPGNEDKCDHAMTSLKQSMKWDEDVYGREYDLDIFMIVAVDDFNAGAMENKGLNIFNSSLVLAKADTATDSDYERIQDVVAHEYFHNWTGNRITCRDWFQLSLKEGLTIYRNQEFFGDMNSKPVKRIEEVNILRTAQFAEDASPMAHPVRPESYIEINNFYTVTVYNKGGELIRMMATFLGESGFFKGMDLYFERHDGQAVTIEDFVKAMEDANNINFDQFRLWYSQSGTPEIKVETEYLEDKNTFVLNLSQTCPATPGQSEKKPFQIPVSVALFGKKGQALPLTLAEGKSDKSKQMVLDLNKEIQRFEFNNVAEEPVLSILRDFSAPVNLKYDVDDNQLLFLISHDTDMFNRWESAQKLYGNTILRLVDKYPSDSLKHTSRNDEIATEISKIIGAFRALLSDTSLEKAIVTQTLSLPNEQLLAQQMEVVDVEGIHLVRETIKKLIASELKTDFLDLYSSLHNTDTVEFSAASASIRGMKNLALDYLMTLQDTEVEKVCLDQFDAAKTMTDEMKALSFLVNESPDNKEKVLGQFYDKWNKDALVMNIWLSIQASSKLSGVNDIKNLMNHTVFDIKNPNKVRSLIAVFCNSNPINFHDAGGSGYHFLADVVIKLNELNPAVAARLLTPLIRWKMFPTKRQEMMKAQLTRIMDTPSLSKNVYEIVSKSLV